jgi:hypothetical protein
VVKLGRRSGVHVTPTVLFDAVEVREMGSSWSEAQWREWLVGNVK